MAKEYTTPEIAIYGEELATTLVASTHTLDKGDHRYAALIERGTSTLMADEAKFEALLSIVLESASKTADKHYIDPRAKKVAEWRHDNARAWNTPNLLERKTIKSDKRHERFVAKQEIQEILSDF